MGVIELILLGIIGALLGTILGTATKLAINYFLNKSSFTSLNIIILTQVVYFLN